LQWFWKSYFDQAEPIALGFAVPNELTEITPDSIARIYRRCATFMGGEDAPLPEVLDARWNLGASEEWFDRIEMPPQTIAIAPPPFDDYLFQKVWKALPPSLAMRPYRDPTGKIIVSDPQSDTGVYVTSPEKNYVLLTRHNRSNNGRCDVTVLAGPNGRALEAVFDFVTENKTLLSLVTTGGLAPSPLIPQDRAPDHFQVLFEVNPRSLYPQAEVVSSRILAEHADVWVQ
jgi:hypothetical protein